jgi:hypothetical protein
MVAKDTANDILVDRNAEGQRDLLRNSGRPQLGLRRFISTIASISPFEGPFGPGLRLRFGENRIEQAERFHPARLRVSGPVIEGSDLNEPRGFPIENARTFTDTSRDF